jgi:soluble lytic murein transglycosylase-like protein
MRFLLFSIAAFLVVSVIKSDSPAIEALENKSEEIMNKLFGTKYDDNINNAANRVGISPSILFNLLNQESRFRDDIITGKVKSKTGALGIAQFMPATAIEQLGSVAAALNPERAIEGAATYLRSLINSFNGDVVKAVAAYNWGIGNVSRKGLKSAPLETKNYVRNILGVSI